MTFPPLHLDKLSGLYTGISTDGRTVEISPILWEEALEVAERMSSLTLLRAALDADHWAAGEVLYPGLVTVYCARCGHPSARKPQNYYQRKDYRRCGCPCHIDKRALGLYTLPTVAESLQSRRRPKPDLTPKAPPPPQPVPTPEERRARLREQWKRASQRLRDKQRAAKEGRKKTV